MADNIERLAGKILVGGFYGDECPHEVLELVEAGMVGAILLFSHNVRSLEQVRDLVGVLNRVPAPERLLLAIDQEGGRVQRLRSPFPEFPPMRLVGARGRKTLARQVGTILGRALGVLGIQQNYAPVLDVDDGPAHAVIGDRAFSGDPSQVARLAAAFVDGLQSTGIAACGKHFPGHGNLLEDSHHELPTLARDLDALRASELVPFRAAARAGVAALMTAHVRVPALDAEHPVTLSEKIIGPILRDEIGFEGVVVSDDLEMRAIADHYGLEDAVVRAVRAGCDQLIVRRGPDAARRAHRALVDAVASGELSEERLREAVDRVEVLKARYAYPALPPFDGEIAPQLPTSEYEAFLSDWDAPAAPPAVARAEEIVEFEFEGDPGLELELDD